MPARTKSRRHSGRKLPGVSRHNAGRKPFYKDHGGSEKTSHSVQDQRIKSIPFRPRRPAKTPAEVVLEESVANFLAERRAKENVEEATKKRAPLPRDGLGYSTELAFGGNIVSDRDLLLTLFMERRIDKVQLIAGRFWQHYLEESTIQPSISIDPSAPLNKQMWQRDGDMTERQYRAMMVRKFAASPLGPASFNFLDRILQPDVGRIEAMQIARMPFGRIAYVLNWLLTGLAIFFGQRSQSDGDVFAAFSEAHDIRLKYRTQWDQDKSQSVPGLLRHHQLQDADAAQARLNSCPPPPQMIASSK